MNQTMNAFNSLLAQMLPESASNLARDVDWAWNVILWTTTFFFFIVVGAMSLFIVKYRRRTANDATPEITHNTPLEIVWTFVPLVIVIYFFYVGFVGFIHYDTPSNGAMPIGVLAKKWDFTFSYPNGAQDRDLYLVIGQAVRLDMTAVDVLHALYIPPFRTQRNLIPNRLTQIWFVPTKESPKEGWPIFCTQYCGDGHSRMFSRVHVLNKADYAEKMKELANPFEKKDEKDPSIVRYVPLYTLGEKLYTQLGCNGCHTLDGKDSTGPTWKGFWARDHEFHFKDPAHASYELRGADPDEKKELYVRDSVLTPDALLVRFGGRNYSGMSSFASQLSGPQSNNEKLRALTLFIHHHDDPNFTKPNPLDPKYIKKDPNNPKEVHPEWLVVPPTPTQPGQ